MNFKPQKNKPIFKGLQQRDDEAYTYLHAKCFVGIKAMVKASDGSEEVAEDIYLEGIERMIKILDKKGENFKGNVPNLFMRICRNIWIDILRAESEDHKLIKPLDDTVPEPADESVVVDPIAKQMEEALFDDFIWQSFNKLKKDCRKILTYFYLDGKSFKEISEILGLTTQYAKKKKYLCKEALIDIASEHPDYLNYS